MARPGWDLRMDSRIDITGHSMHDVDIRVAGSHFRKLQQWATSPGISTTTATAIGVIFGGIVLVVIICYCFTIARRQRNRQAEELMRNAMEEEQARRAAARAERRRLRMLPKGVPADIIAQFPITVYTRPEKHESKLDRTTRKQMMSAAATALAEPDLSSDEESDLRPPAAIAGPSSGSMIMKIKSVIRPRSIIYSPHTARANQPLPTQPQSQVSARSETLGPAAVAAVAAGAGDGGSALAPDQADLPGISLAAAHRASCAAASNMGRAPPALRANSLRTASGQLPSPPLAALGLGPAAAAPGAMVQPGQQQQSFIRMAHLPEGAEGAVSQTDDVLQCAICLCDFEDGDMLRKLPCEHDFHRECIDSWMQQHTTCPLCRFILHVHHIPPLVPPHTPEGLGAPGLPAMGIPAGPAGPGGVEMMPPPLGPFGYSGPGAVGMAAAGQPRASYGASSLQMQPPHRRPPHWP